MIDIYSAEGNIHSSITKGLSCANSGLMILGIKFLNQLVILKMFLFKKSNTMFMAKHYLRKTESGYSLRKESDKEDFCPSIEINLLNGRILPIIPEPISNRIVSPSVNPFILQGDVLIAPLTYEY